VNPRFHAFGHVTHPLTGIDGQVANQFKGRQRSEREFRRKVAGQRAASQTRLTIDHHGAGTTNPSAADEVKL